MATFTKNDAEWNHLLRGKGGMVYNHIETLTERLRRFARRDVGKDTRKLYNSIKSSMKIGSRGGPVGTVLADSKIARLHHDGTRAHLIRPRRQNTLRFPSRGRIVYTKIVHHPGTKPNRFLTDNLRRVID
jgi:hypothetical protein